MLKKSKGYQQAGNHRREGVTKNGPFIVFLENFLFTRIVWEYVQSNNLGIYVFGRNTFPQNPTVSKEEKKRTDISVIVRSRLALQ